MRYLAAVSMIYLCTTELHRSLLNHTKLVPLTPAGDISVGYYLYIYKSMKLFKGLNAYAWKCNGEMFDAWIDKIKAPRSDAFGKDETDWFLKNLHRDKEAMQKLNRLQSKYSQYRHSASAEFGAL